MSDYDNNLFSIPLLKGRLGIYEKEPYNDAEQSLDGVHQYAARAEIDGFTQQERMIKDKRRTLDRAVWYSYQAARIKKLTDDTIIRALINPDKLKLDYDDKILSVGFEYGFKPGDIFEWIGTDTKWLICLQDMTELAYFRGDIRKCTHVIQWKDENDKIHSTYTAVRGPVETKVNFIQKYKTSFDIPNYSLHLLMPLNDETKSFFKRYSEFYLQGHDTCWRVEATDEISSPGVLEVTALEYYANKDEDDIQNGINDGLIVKPVDPNPQENLIEGETFIKVKKTYTYTYTGTEDSTWQIDQNNYPIVYTIDSENPKKIYLKWDYSYSGEFPLRYGSTEKLIVVESLF